MCGIFGIISKKGASRRDLGTLVYHSQQRGRDSSGLIYHQEDTYRVRRADHNIEKLLREVHFSNPPVIMGHSRLITNGLSDNQPVVRDGVIVLHNGIIVNHEEVWPQLSVERNLQIDTEVIAAIAEEHLREGHGLDSLADRVLDLCKGVVACAIALPERGKLLLFSNNGSLYKGKKEDETCFASESFPLDQVGCVDIEQVRECVIIDLPRSENPVDLEDHISRKENLIPVLQFSKSEERLLQYPRPNLRRCSRCILPETMPYIKFDEEGVCNYCRNYKLRNKPRPKEELFDLVESYRRQGQTDCIVPFSGGRDSCYALHLIVNELKMNPVTYTYDWGMVTDLGRRNISRMCSALGVENIIIADDISQKRRNIRMNLEAWLRSPHLGMLSILTAGDKHFFRHVETVKEQTGVSLNLWGVNPLEVTHFKAGFLGIEPDFESKWVYTHGVYQQLRYQFHRFSAMLESPGYFNTSLWDTLSGEYYRSFTEKKDYFHIFDYWRWDEKLIEDTLEEYDWERAPDTKTTWRIGDGTAAFYNYAYYTVAGFTEHDTFRSNQIREGEISREKALELADEENQPRYPNIRWYLDAVGVDFEYAIKVINAIPKLYNWEEAATKPAMSIDNSK
ncbi:MAG: glucosamine 6-phosphate synthetase [Leptospiraceae bacterium]|nr:glucosamine 6-phosphate synthetase [Leptospiraceae bacterium]